MSKPTPAQLVHMLDREPTEEPAITTGGKSASVAGILSLILYMFPDISDNWLKAIIVLLAVGLPMITAFATRGNVWSPASVNVVVKEAVERAVEVTQKLERRNKYTAKEAKPYKFPPDISTQG